MTTLPGRRLLHTAGHDPGNVDASGPAGVIRPRAITSI